MKKDSTTRKGRSAKAGKPAPGHGKPKCISAAGDMSGPTQAWELAQQSAIIEAVMESLDGPIFLVDRNYRYISFNLRHAGVMKALFDADIEIGCSLLDYHTNPDDRMAARKNIDRALSGEPVTVESYAGEETRTRRYFEISHNPVRDSGGEVIGVAVYARDLTERRQAEETLKKSEKRYRLLFENMLDGFAYCKMLFDDRGRPEDFVYLDVNSAFGRLTGLESVIGKKVTEVIPGIKESHPELFEIYGRAALTGRPEKFELELKPLGVWLSISVYSTERDYFTAVFDNITVRKRAEEAGKRSHDKLEMRVLKRTAELVRINDELEKEIAERRRAEENILRLNRLYSVLSKINEAIVRIHDAERLYEHVCRIAVEDGQFKMAWIGLTDPETQEVKPVASWGDAGGYLDTIRVVAGDVPEGKGPTGRAVVAGEHFICSDIEHDPIMRPWRDKSLKHGFRSSAGFPLRIGTDVIGALTIYSHRPSYFTEEETALLVSMADDVSFAIASIESEKKQRAAEDALRRLNEELDLKVRERTAGLEAANKEMEAFSFSVSHDLRAPLRALSGISRIIMEDYAGQLDDKGKELLAIIRANAKKMEELINALLALSKIGRQRMKISEIDMEKLARSVNEGIGAVAPARAISLVVTHLPPAEGDAVLLRQVFENLLSNAVKFTRLTGNASVEVGGWSEERERIYYVKDNGVGFDMRYADKLYNAFQRLHSPKDFEGTGIGLSIIHRIIQRHGGRVWAEGKVDEGATFYFTLPNRHP